MAEPGADGETLKLIRQIVLEEAGKLGVRVEKIILFGSRARGEAGEESDYDILVVAGGKPSRATLRRLSDNIRWRLAQQLIQSDVIVTTKRKWITYQNTIGHLYYTIKKEGIPV